MSYNHYTYLQYLVYAAKYAQMPKPEVSDFLVSLMILEKSLHAQGPFYFVIDYTQLKFLFIHPSLEKILGYDYSTLLELGPKFFTSLWHPDDFDVYNKAIFPEQITILKQNSISDYPNISFTFNYRAQKKSGDYVSLLQCSTYLSSLEDGYPLAAIGFLVDITNFKDSSRMAHTIEKTDWNSDSLSKTTLSKSIHYPDKSCNILSKREREILQSIYQGMSSKQIANKHAVSINTVNNHRKNMLKKTNANNSAELIKYALSKDLI